jgi:hypothetical protein
MTRMARSAKVVINWTIRGALRGYSPEIEDDWPAYEKVRRIPAPVVEFR